MCVSKKHMYVRSLYAYLSIDVGQGMRKGFIIELAF